MSKQISVKGMLNLIVVYLIWGSTYLFIRVTVREGSGFPPFSMAASRTFCAAAVLFLLAACLGYRLKRPGPEMRVLLFSGMLLWIGGNGLVAWAERHANSGYAALVVGTAPMWPVIMQSFIDRELPSPLLILSLLIGFAGLAVLVTPIMRLGGRADATSTLALMFAAASWAGGSFLLQRRPPKAEPLVISAYQQLFGSFGLLSVMLLTGEPWPHPTAAAWCGWAYLVVAGSLISFTSYVVAVRTLPITVVMTYAYVNPVIAVMLGRLVLGEPITSSTVLGTVLILLGVSGIFWKRFGSGGK
jgi:drug/metabolite transporter (DMT)-like permease